MDSTTTPITTLPIHEFPDGPVLLGDWRSTYRSATLGNMLLRRTGPVERIVSRMHHIHVSRIRWYSTHGPLVSSRPQLRTFELASGSQWESPTETTQIADHLAHLNIPREHQHHYMVAEISLSTPLQHDSLSPQDTAILGYLRIDGTCRSDAAPPDATSHHPSIPDAFLPASTHRGRGSRQHSNPPSRLSTGTLNNLDYFRSQSTNASATFPEGSSPLPPHASIYPPYGSSFMPISDLSIPSLNQEDEDSPLTNDSETTPIARRQRRSVIEGTPTRGRSLDFKESELPGSSSSFIERPIYINDPQDTTASSLSVAQDPDTDEDASFRSDAVDVPRRLDLSYLDKPSPSSPLFISPFASRSNSVAPSRSSTGASQATRPSSRSNSSNATSFTTSSSFSLSSAGLVFSNGPLNQGVDAGLSSEDDTRFVVMYLGPHFEGFPGQNVENGRPSQTDECLLELTFSPEQGAARRDVNQGPHGFLTLRDLTILADIVEHSFKVERREAADISDSSSESAASESDSGSEPSAISIATRNASPTCCCEFYRRLFSVIPLVSGLRPTGTVTSDEAGLRAAGGTVETSSTGLSHYGRFSHRGRYLKAPFKDDDEDDEDLQLDDQQRFDYGPSSASSRRLKAKLERKRAQFDRELIHAAKSVNQRARYTASAAAAASGPSSDSREPRLGPEEEGRVSPLVEQGPSVSTILALEEAKRATELFCKAVREVELLIQSSSTSSDEEVGL